MASFIADKIVMDGLTFDDGGDITSNYTKRTKILTAEGVNFI